MMVKERPHQKIRGARRRMPAMEESPEPMEGTLEDNGYEQVQPLVFRKTMPDGLEIIHDYRRGKRQTYGYKDGKSVNVRGHPEHKRVKAREAECQTTKS